MADETKVVAQAAAEAPAKVTEAVAETVEKIVDESAKVAKQTRAAAARSAKRAAVAAKPAPRRAKAVRRKTRISARKVAKKTVRATHKRNPTVTNNNFFNGFDAVPAFAPFQSLFAERQRAQPGSRQEDPKGRWRTGRARQGECRGGCRGEPRAAEGAKAIGQKAVSSQRNGFEQAADAIRSLAEAKSPTEYLQLQSEFARASFDRAISDSSKLTKSLVKLAGEASSRSRIRSANAERFNTLVA